MIEQTSIDEALPLTEAELVRNEKRRIRNQKRRKSLKRHCCKKCGQQKHYVCLEHHQFKKTEVEKFLERPLPRIQYYLRKLYFSSMRKLKFIE